MALSAPPAAMCCCRPWSSTVCSLYSCLKRPWEAPKESVTLLLLLAVEVGSRASGAELGRTSFQDGRGRLVLLLLLAYGLPERLADVGKKGRGERSLESRKKENRGDGS